jgi:CHAT domain-containing protein
MRLASMPYQITFALAVATCFAEFAGADSDVASSGKGKRDALLVEAKKLFAQATEAEQAGKWGLGLRLHERALKLREEAFPAEEYPNGDPELVHSLVATANSLLAFDLVKGLPLARRAQAMASQLGSPEPLPSAVIHLLLARYDSLQKRHDSPSLVWLETHSKFSTEVSELDILHRLECRQYGLAQKACERGFSGGPFFSLTIENRLKTPVSLHQVTLDEWKLLCELNGNGGSTTIPQTREGSLYLICDAAGKVIAAFEAAVGDHRAVVDTSENMQKTADPELIPDRSVKRLDWRTRIALEFGNDLRAEQLIKTIAAVRPLTHPPDHPAFARLHTSAAMLARLRGNYEASWKAAIEAERIWKKVGDGHECIEAARTLRELGLAEHFLGKKHAALQRFADADRLRRRLSIDHEAGEPIGSFELAIAFRWAKQHDEAEKWARRCVSEVVRFLDRRAEQFSEVGQIVNLSHRLHSLLPYVDFALAAGRSPAHMYEAVLEWKGIALNREIESRRTWHALKKSDPSVAALLNQLDDKARQFVAAEAALPDEAAEIEHRQYRSVTRKEWLDTMIALRQKQNEEYRRNPLPRTTLAQIQAALPPDAAFVDFVSYTTLTSGNGPMVAFVVTREDVRLQRLEGASAAYTLVPEFEKQVQRGRIDRSPMSVGSKLRDTFWKPIEPHLAGRKTVLICPDSWLCPLTFAALPTSDGKRYLLEDYGFVQIAVAKQLSHLLAEPAWRPASHASMLAFGDVDFGKTPAAKAESASVKLMGKMGLEGEWPQLRGTAAEIDGIRTLFENAFPKGSLQIWRGLQASTARFREHSPRCSMLHLATHGCAQRDSSRAYPGTLDGIAFANANAPNELDSGFVSTLEMKNFDFSGLRLAVLSACESGIGMITSSGEGMLGAPRTLQIAGARSVIASNWKVDDEATRVLMERFYANYWNKNMTKLAALREAQLWMLNDGKKALSDSTLRGIARLNPSPSAEADDRRLPPSLWAAFVLHGDWR